MKEKTEIKLAGGSVDATVFAGGSYAKIEIKPPRNATELWSIHQIDRLVNELQQVRDTIEEHYVEDGEHESGDEHG